MTHYISSNSRYPIYSPWPATPKNGPIPTIYILQKDVDDILWERDVYHEWLPDRQTYERTKITTNMHDIDINV